RCRKQKRAASRPIDHKLSRRYRCAAAGEHTGNIAGCADRTAERNGHPTAHLFAETARVSLRSFLSGERTRRRVLLSAPSPRRRDKVCEGEGAFASTRGARSTLAQGRQCAPRKRNS